MDDLLIFDDEKGVENVMDENISLIVKTNKELTEARKIIELETSNYSSSKHSQPAHTTLPHALDDTAKLTYTSIKNLRPRKEDRPQTTFNNYLHTASNAIIHFDKGGIDLPQLPENITKNKTVWSDHNVTAYSNLKKKYYSRYIIENLKTIVKKWVKTLNIKNRSELDWTTNERKTYSYLIEKLEPIALDRGTADSDYKTTLKLNITAIVDELSLFENHNSNLIDHLVNEIIAIDCKIPIRYIQPTDAEIRRFVQDEIVFVLDKCYMTICSAKMEDLEKKIINCLLNLVELEDVNDCVIEEITNTFTDIVKLPASNAKYFSKIILNDYKDFFFRQHYFARRDNEQKSQPEVSLGLKNSINHRYWNQYTDLVEKEIEKWFTNLNIQIKDSETNIQKLASDIVERKKLLSKHPNLKGTTLEELDHLKCQVFKRASNLIGLSALEQVEELLKRINCLPVPSFNIDNQYLENSNESVDRGIDSLINIISDWFIKVPTVAHTKVDIAYNKQFIKILAKDIEKSIDDKKLEFIDAKIDQWILDIFKGKLSNTLMQQLKNKILLYVISNAKNWEVDPEKWNIIKNYKSIIYSWISTFSLQLNKEYLFICNLNKYVQELTLKIHDTINRFKDKIPSVDFYNTLREVIQESMKILPLDEQSNQYKDKYASTLVTNIKLFHGQEANATKSRQANSQWLIDKIEDKMVNCIQKFSQNSNNSKDSQKSVELNDLPKYTTYDDSLEASVEAWLNKLPIHVTDFVYFKIKKNTFIENIKLLRALGATDEIIIHEIISFMKILPMDIIRPQDYTYLKEEKSIDDVNPVEIQDDTAKIIELTIKKWAIGLTATPKYNPKNLNSLINKIVPLICHLINHLERNLNNKKSHLIRDEIVKFFDKFPQKRFSEQTVTQLSNCLTNNLKGIIYSKTRDNIVNNETLKKNEIDSDTVKDNLETYSLQIINEIGNWVNNYIKGEKKEFDLTNDLAKDTTDRDVYLKLNSTCQQKCEEETEQLKLKVLQQCIGLADTKNIDIDIYPKDVTKRGKNMSIGLFSKDSQVYMQAGSSDLREEETKTPKTKRRTGNLDDHTTSDHSFREKSSLRVDNKSSPGELDMNKPVSIRDENENIHATYQNPKEVIFNKYQSIFKNKVYDLPIYAPTPESEQLSELARTGIYNGIMKTFFSLKSDQELENDYGYFELILEDRLDEMLDLLPQTEEMKKVRHSWKVNILGHAMDMLKEMQDISDRLSFRQRLKDGFNRKFAKNFELEQCFLLQQGFLAEMAEAFILETKYKEDDPLKANIYKQRLMKKVDEMANHLTRQHNVEFRFLKKPQLIQHAMKILAEVPIPNDDILNDEVEEILLAEEIEQWYKELPVTPYINDFDQVFRKRMMNVLAQKIHEIDKIEDDLDHSKERLIKHEISIFLSRRGRLERDKDLDINFMVDELTNRLKNHQLKGSTNYDSFKQKKPISSTLVELDNTEILAPLIDASTIIDVENQPYRTTNQHRSFVRQRPLFGASQVPNQGFMSKTDPQYYGIHQDQQPMVGIPFQWPAEQGHSVHVSTQDINDSKIPYFDPNVEQNIDLPVRPDVMPRQDKFRPAQRINARKPIPLSPKVSPVLRRRKNSPDSRSSRPPSPYKANIDNTKIKPDLESIYTKPRQTRRSPPSSVSVNSEINRPCSQCTRKSVESRMGNVDDNQSHGALYRSCLHQAGVRCNPNCKARQIPHQVYDQGSTEQNMDKPQLTVKCKCPQEFDKLRCICFDTQPCSCKLIVKPCKFY